MSKEEFFKEESNFFESINRRINDYIENIKNPNYQIAIVGAIKAGKSTLINALIGHELASTNVTPETATLTKFKYSEKNCLKIKFYTKNDWDKIWYDATEKKATTFIEGYKQLNADEVKNLLLNKKDVYQEFDSIEEMKKEISRWTSSRSKEHYFVKELEIGINDLKLPTQICLVDTPGLNDVIDYRSKITRNYISNANAVIVCVNAKTLRNEEFLTITKVFSKARYKKDKGCMKRLALNIVCLTCVLCNCIAQTASLCIKDHAQQNKNELIQPDSMKGKKVPSYRVTQVESTHRLRWTGKTFIGKHKDKANTWLIKAVIKGMDAKWLRHSLLVTAKDVWVLKDGF